MNDQFRAESRSTRGHARRGASALRGYGALLPFALLVGSLACSEPRPPNIFLIVVDTLRADHLGTYGYERDTSPHIDRFAADALVFERSLAHAPETRFSMPSLLTGFLPHETGSLDAISLPAGVESLAELLEPEAYQRIAVVSNYVLHEGRGFEQGFEIYDDEMTDREQARDWPERIASRTTDRALELVRDRKQHQPLFMWIHYEDPHGPYTAPEPFTELFDDLERPPRPLRRLDGVSGYGGIPSYQQASPSTDYHRYVSRYDAEIRYLDHELGRFLDGLREMGLYEDSILILTSDHGEGMGEREYFFAHGESLHGSLLRVPLIIRHGQRLRGRRSDLVQHVDLVPTIRAMLGLAPDSRLRGRDLREPSERPVEVVSEMNSSLLRIGSAQSLVTQHWKLIRVPQSGRAALFDLEHDPQELNNLASDPEYADRLATLSGRLEDLRSSDRLGLTTSVAPPVLSEAERARLEALGYAR